MDSWLKDETYESVDPNSPKLKNLKVNTSVLKETKIILQIVVALCLKYKKNLKCKVQSRKDAHVGRVS